MAEKERQDYIDVDERKHPKTKVIGRSLIEQTNKAFMRTLLLIS